MIPQLPDASLDVVVTSPPYWGQRTSLAHGVEDDPRDYVRGLTGVFAALLPKLKRKGILWVNLGDAYNTPVNWRYQDRAHSSLGHSRNGLAASNSAYTKPRLRRRAFLAPDTAWLRYGNLLALPHRLTLALCDAGYLFRGEVIWKKLNPLPEGRCRRPHRQHESVYLFAREERHRFRVIPPVPSVWEFGNAGPTNGTAHFSRFPEELPQRCISAYGELNATVVVCDPFSGSGTTGIAARKLGCTYIGFEVDPTQVDASNARLEEQ